MSPKGGVHIELRATRGEFVLRQSAEPATVLQAMCRRCRDWTRDRHFPCRGRTTSATTQTCSAGRLRSCPSCQARWDRVIWETVDNKTKLELAAAHGGALTQLHQATFGAPGPYDAEREAFVATDDFRGWTLDGIESLRARCRAIDALRRKPSATSTS